VANVGYYFVFLAWIWNPHAVYSSSSSQFIADCARK